MCMAVPACLPDGSSGWAFNWNFKPKHKDVYLAQWSILDHAPHLIDDIRQRSLWRSWWRFVWTHVFIGPAGTVTGLHNDDNPNMFASVRGSKDWILFPPGNDDALQPGTKYDYGAQCSIVDISQLSSMPAHVKASFQRARGGVFARVEPGDMLYVPPRTWHAVVSPTMPCISLSMFGLQLRHIFVNGIPGLVRYALHCLGLYRVGHCTCCKNCNAASTKVKGT